MTEEQKYLPKHILDKAVISGKEYAWREQDFKEAVMAANSVGLGIIGGQVQFLLPDGTCELYWRTFDPEDRKDGENWKHYCNRTAKECIEKFDTLTKTIDLIKEGQESFEFLKNKTTAGIDIAKYLIFVLYFNDIETGLD